MRLLALGLGTIALWALSAAPGQAAIELGRTGMWVEVTPTCLMLKALEPSSPAGLANVPDPTRQLVRLDYLNGQPILELLDGGRLAEALDRPLLTLSFGVRQATSTEERIVGPYLLDMVDRPDNRLRRYFRARQYDRVAALLHGPELASASLTQGWARMVFEANELARAGRFGEAAQLGGLRNAGDPAPELGAARPGWQAEALWLRAEDERLSPRETVHAGPNPAMAPPPAPARATFKKAKATKPNSRRAGRRRC